MSEPTPADAVAATAETRAGDDLLAGLADDFLRRHQAGERPSVDEYARKHPELAGRIRDLFPAIMMMEHEPAPPAERLGAMVGRYKLLERIGEGGFGVVYMAEQITPVRRKVALKVIKPGVDTKQVIARFEAERQALALMDHENIAKVLDAGATETGRPYFVMELVHGVPITEYCDRNQLPPPERLGLFVQVCRAVQHAHTKGIIHRDLKPTNVLVTLHEGVAVPKVIDFGVAKATGQQLTEKTLFTHFAQMVGTPLYMSPEQAEMTGVDVDTRSDIYSLGVMLYELLTGTTPLDKQRVKQAAFDEVRRIIREEEPPRPSTRISTMGEEAQRTISARRRSDPKHLGKLVRGELDWIVMMALEKDRRRRYETASGLARDVERYLNDEPVLACPPSLGYRLRKFVRRNKGPVIAASIIFLLLVGGIVGTTAGLVWAVRERNDKARALVAQTKAREAEKQARDVALAALRAMADDIVEQQMARDTQLTEENKQFLRNIIKHFEGLAAVTADDAESRAIRAEGYFRVGFMRNRLGELKEAEAAYGQALALQEQLAADFPTRPEFRHALARTHRHLGVLLRATGQLKQAEGAYGAAVVLQKQLAADFPTRPEFRYELARTHNNLSVLFSVTGRTKEAEVAYGQALALFGQLAGEFPTHPEFRQHQALIHNNLGILFRATGRPKEAEAAYVQALAVRRQLLADFPARSEFRQDLALSHHDLGLLLRETGRRREAEAAYREALALQKQLAADFPTRPEFRRDLARSHHNLGDLLVNSGQLKEGETAIGEALVLRRQLACDFPAHPELRQELALTIYLSGYLLRSTGRPEEADAAAGEALALRKQLATDFPTRPEFRQELASSHNDLGIRLSAAGRLKEAEAAYGEALVLQKQLVSDFPDQPDLQNSLAGTCVNLAVLRLTQQDFKAAKGYLEEARPRHEAALMANPRHPGYRQFYRNHLTVLIQTNAGLGDHEAAKHAAQKLRDVGWDPPGNAYDAARYLSSCIPIVQSDDRATKEERDQQAAFYGDEAMKMLRDAVTEGFNNLDQMNKSKDLDPLREREDFKRLLAELEKLPSSTRPSSTQPVSH